MNVCSRLELHSSENNNGVNDALYSEYLSPTLEPAGRGGKSNREIRYSLLPAMFQETSTMS